MIRTRIVVGPCWAPTFLERFIPWMEEILHHLGSQDLALPRLLDTDIGSRFRLFTVSCLAGLKGLSLLVSSH